MLCPLCLAIVVHFSQKIAFLSHLLSHKDYFIEEIFFYQWYTFLIQWCFFNLIIYLSSRHCSQHQVFKRETCKLVLGDFPPPCLGRTDSRWRKRLNCTTWSTILCSPTKRNAAFAQREMLSSLFSASSMKRKQTSANWNPWSHTTMNGLTHCN